MSMQNSITNYELEITNNKNLNMKKSIRNSQFVITNSASLPVSDKFVIRNYKFVIDKRIS